LNSTDHVGPEVKRYNPSEGSERRYKDGIYSSNDTICKIRYQQISVTALGEVNTTTTPAAGGVRRRALVTTPTKPVYKMTLKIATTDFKPVVAVSSDTKLYMSIAILFMVNVLLMLA